MATVCVLSSAKLPNALMYRGRLYHKRLISSNLESILLDIRYSFSF